MTSGIFGYKGRVHLHICKPIKECDDTGKLASLIQEEIINNYRLWPSNHTAVSILPKLNNNYLTMEVSPESQTSHSYFKNRFKNLNFQQKEEMLMIYARPLINKEKARLTSGP